MSLCRVFQALTLHRGEAVGSCVCPPREMEWIIRIFLLVGFCMTGSTRASPVLPAATPAAAAAVHRTPLRDGASVDVFVNSLDIVPRVPRPGDRLRTLLRQFHYSETLRGTPRG